MVNTAQVALKKELNKLVGKRTELDSQIKAIESALVALGGKSVALGGRVLRSPMSAAERKSVSKRMKRYWAKRRAMNVPKA